jgi:hypothetical protein
MDHDGSSIINLLESSQRDLGYATGSVVSNASLQSAAPATTLRVATPPTTGRTRGPVAKRRFQKGCFQLKKDTAYTFYYEDHQLTDGTLGSRKVRHLIGRVGPGGMSERAARREHDRTMQEVNRKRGSVPPAAKGQTFGDAYKAWRTEVGPHLSPATVRQERATYGGMCSRDLRTHPCKRLAYRHFSNSQRRYGDLFHERP